jgi:hypothetical protein
LAPVLSNSLPQIMKTYWFSGSDVGATVHVVVVLVFVVMALQPSVRPCPLFQFLDFIHSW